MAVISNFECCTTIIITWIVQLKLFALKASFIVRVMVFVMDAWHYLLRPFPLADWLCSSEIQQLGVREALQARSPNDARRGSFFFPIPWFTHHSWRWVYQLPRTFEEDWQKALALEQSSRRSGRTTAYAFLQRLVLWKRLYGLWLCTAARVGLLRKTTKFDLYCTIT